MSSTGRTAVVDRLCDFFILATQTALFAQAVYPRGTVARIQLYRDHRVVSFAFA